MVSVRSRFNLVSRVVLLVSVALFVGKASLSMAVPAYPAGRIANQADGSKLEVFQKGDEYFNWTEDSSGHVLGYDRTSKNWRYATIAKGKVTAGSLKAKSSSNFSAQPAPSSALTAGDLKPLIEKAQTQRAPQVADSTGTVSQGTTLSKTVERVSAIPRSNLHPDLLVILVEFKDAPLTQSIDYWTDKYFSTASGVKSVDNYYKEASGAEGFSFSQISFVGGNQTISDPTSEISSLQLKDGVVKATFDVKHPADSGATDATDAYVEKAFSAASKYIDFSSYPTTSDGYILRDDFHVSSVVSGWEASANSAKAQSTWAHANSEEDSSGSAVSVGQSDGTLYSYATQGEIYSGSSLTSSATPMGIGVTTHELGHDLGLPDLYDYGYDSQGVGAYSLMAGGAWGYASGGYPSETPVQLDAWSRVALGFETPVTISANQVNQYSLKSNSAADPAQYNVYKITSSVNANQYFLVENRQRDGYDAGLYGATGGTDYTGILIYHVDKNMLAVGGGSVDDDAYHKGVDIEEADGSNQLDESDSYLSGAGGVYSNHFFTQSGNSTFDAASVPSSNFHTATAGVHPAVPQTDDVDCHPETVASNVLIKVDSDSGATMTFLNGATSLIPVAFDAGGGTVASSSLAYTGTPLVLPTPTFAGYTFDGWYTASTGGDKVESPYVPSTATTLYAHWTVADECGVTFAAAGGSTPSALLYAYGQTLGALPTSTKSGYAFQGWYDPSGVQVSSTTGVYADMTLTARWKSKYAYVTSVAKTTGTWNKPWSKTSYYPSYRVLTISRYKSSVRIAPAKSANARLSFRYKGGSYARISTYRTVSLSRGQYKTLYFHCLSETGTVTHTYKLIVKRKK